MTAGRGRGTVTVLANQPNTLSVQLESLGVIRGTLLQSGVLTPLKGWTVDLYQVDPFGPRSADPGHADGRGRRVHVPRGVGRLLLPSARTADGLAAEATASGQVTRGGQLVEVPLVATIERRITATVTGHRRHRQRDARRRTRRWTSARSGEACRSTVGNGQGVFRQDDLPLGRFYVRAIAQVTGNPTAGTAGGTLLFEGDVADITVSLLGLSTIEGTVFETRQRRCRRPAANASVRLTGQPGSGCPVVCLQSTGRRRQRSAS